LFDVEPKLLLAHNEITLVRTLNRNAALYGLIIEESIFMSTGLDRHPQKIEQPIVMSFILIQSLLIP